MVPQSVLSFSVGDRRTEYEDKQSFSLLFRIPYPKYIKKPAFQRIIQFSKLSTFKIKLNNDVLHLLSDAGHWKINIEWLDDRLEISTVGRS